MQPLVQYLLLDFEGAQLSPEEKEYYQKAFSSVKLNLSELQGYKETDHFTTCICQAILTEHNEGSLYDWELMQSNPAEFKEVMALIAHDKHAYSVWVCEFCGNKNILLKKSIHFAHNKSKVIQKKSGQGEKKEAILLLLIDISGSMSQLIENRGLLQIIKHIRNTKIYKTIIKEEEREIQRILEEQVLKGKDYGNTKKINYHNYLNKTKLLLGITQYLIEKMNSQRISKGGWEIYKNKIKKKDLKKIGIILFNSNVYLNWQLEAKPNIEFLRIQHSPEKNVKDDKQYETANFDEFDSLFALGQNYGQKYSAKLSEADFANLHLQLADSYVQGQTALGPAMAIALGITSKHGAGSTIFVVTDGMANKGILDERKQWFDQFEKIRKQLEFQKCFLGVLECRRNQRENQNETKGLNIQDKKEGNQKYAKQKVNDSKGELIVTGLDEFCKKHQESIAHKIDVWMQGCLQSLQEKVKKLINRSNDIWTNSVSIYCQHPCVNYKDVEHKLSRSLFSSHQPYHMCPRINSQQLSEKDYVHSFTTQIMVRYEDTKTGQQSVFMSYIRQKLVRFSTLKRYERRKIENKKTYQRLQEYISVDYDKLRLIDAPLNIVDSFSKSVMFGSKKGSFRFPSKKNSTLRNNSNMIEMDQAIRFCGRMQEFSDKSDNQILYLEQKI